LHLVGAHTTASSPPPPFRLLVREIVQGSGFYSLPVVAQRLVGFVLLPLYTRRLTPADYGVLDLLDQSFSLFAIVFGINYSAALAYHFFENDSPAMRSRTVSTAMVGAGLIGIVAAAAGVALATAFSRLVFGTDSYSQYFQIMAAATGLSFIIEAGFAWLRVENRAALSSLIAILRLAISAVLVCVFLLVFHLKVSGVLFANILTSAVITLVIVAYWVNSTRVTFDVSLFLRMLRYSMPIALTCIAMFILHSGDRFILQRYGNLSVIGIYSLGYKIGMLVALIHGAFNTYWFAQVFQIAKRDDGREVISRTFTYMAAVLSLVALGLIVVTPVILALVVGPAFAPAAAIVPLIVVAYLVRAFGDFFRALFYVANRPGLDAASNWIGALVCVAACFLLIPRYGMWGAATATLIAFLVIGLLVMVWTRALMPIHLEAVRLTKLFAVLTASLCLFFMVPTNSTAAQLSWAAVILVLFVGGLWMVRFPTVGERQLVVERAAIFRSRLARGRI